MTEHERARLEEGYEKYWKAALPTVQQAQIMEIAVGPTPLVDGRPKPLAPTQYIEFMRTGKAAWWMEVAGPNITIGCAQYGGWTALAKKPTSCSHASAGRLATPTRWHRSEVWS